MLRNELRDAGSHQFCNVFVCLLGWGGLTNKQTNTQEQIRVACIDIRDMGQYTRSKTPRWFGVKVAYHLQIGPT